jgi:hypothetical protein
MKIIWFIYIFILNLIFFAHDFAQDNANEKGNKENCEITGSILEKTTQNPIPGVTVRIIGTQLGGTSNSLGKYLIKNIPAGIYSVRFSAIGYEPYVEANIVFNTAKPIIKNIELVPKVIELKGAEVRGSYFVKRVETVTSTQSFNAEDIRRAPGVQEDVIRATALLPGVGITQAGRNDLVVRGGAPFENLFIVDNIEIPNINHFGSQGASGGPLALINIDLVKNVDFSSGGFGALYGDKLSSISNITLRNGNDQKFGGNVNLSATGFGVLFEGPISDKGSYIINVRRSYLDLLFKAAGFGFIPQYWDLQTKVNYKIDNENSLNFLLIGALDDVTLDNSSLDKRYKNSSVAIPNQKQYFTGLTWKKLFGNGYGNITLGRTFTYFDTYQNDSLLNPIFKNFSYEGENTLKTDFDFQLAPKLELFFGNQVKWATKLKYDILIPANIRKDINGIGHELRVDTNFRAYKNSTYVSLTTALGQNKFTVGGRLDYFNFVTPSVFLSPRVSFIYVVDPVSSIIFSGGRYYQSPSYIWLIGDKNQDLKPIRADQLVLGYEHTPFEELKVQLEVYYKWYSNYPARVFRPQAVLSPSGFDDITSDIPFGLEPLQSSGTGFSRGIELFIQKKLSEIPLYGLLSISVSDTRFKSLDGVERVGSYDARFILNIALGYQFSNGWELSGKFRAATGLPSTPFKSDSSGTLDYSQYHDGPRFPFFNQLDVRIDKRWDMGGFALNVYLDIQNIYNRINPTNIRWNYRKQIAEYDNPIGILPSIGVNFEF